jgi:hypothetical protein
MVGSVSSIGLSTRGFYHLESVNWQAQSIGQDIMDLFLVIPVLLISAALAYAGSRAAKFTWAGTLLYLVYTFAIYCFDVHFNSLFYFYCLCLGLSFYSLLYFLHSEVLSPDNEIHQLSSTTRTIGVYFIATSIVFNALWLSDVITAILYDTLPKGLIDTGLPTNPVQVMDLAIILPALAGTGILLLRENRIGFLLAPALLVFTLLMNLTIAGLNIVMLSRGLEFNRIVMVVMLGLAVFSFILLLSHWRSKNPNQSTFRTT